MGILEPPQGWNLRLGASGAEVGYEQQQQAAAFGEANPLSGTWLQTMAHCAGFRRCPWVAEGLCRRDTLAG